MSSSSSLPFASAVAASARGSSRFLSLSVGVTAAGPVLVASFDGLLAARSFALFWGGRFVGGPGSGVVAVPVSLPAAGVGAAGLPAPVVLGRSRSAAFVRVGPGGRSVRVRASGLAG